MKLQEKFKQWLNTKPTETLRDIQCEIIADEFAVSFAEWTCIYAYRYTKENYMELLIIYKKERGL